MAITTAVKRRGKQDHNGTGRAAPEVLPSLERATAGAMDSVGKTWVCSKDKEGADLYVWAIRADQGQWMAEFGCSPPDDLRKEGFPRHDAAMSPVKAKKYPSRAAAEIAAVERAIAWLDEVGPTLSGTGKIVYGQVVRRAVGWQGQALQRAETGERGCVSTPVEPVEPEPVKLPKKNRGADARPLAKTAKAAVSRETASIVPADAPVEMVNLDSIEILPGNPEPDPDVVAEILQHGIDEPVILLAPGRLVCAANVELTCDASKFLLLAGATRLTAARKSGATEIPSRIREEPLHLADAVAFALRSNTGRRVVTTAERAGRVKQLADCGMSDKQIAAKLAINEKEINQLRRLSSLPAVWRDRVTRYERTGGDDPDCLSWSAAKALLPVVDLPRALERIEQDWASQWGHDEMTTRDGFRESVESAVRDATRSVFPEQEVKLTEEQRAKLDLRKFRIGDGAEISRACCSPETYAEVFPHDRRPNASMPFYDAADNQPAKATASKPELSDRELAAKHKKDDADLRDRIHRSGGLAELGLRIACRNSPALKPGSEVTRSVVKWLGACARNSSAASDLNPDTWLVSAVKIWAATNQVKMPKLKSREAYSGPTKAEIGRYLAAVADSDDSVGAWDEIDVILCQIVLWPETDIIDDPDLYPSGKWPERVPWIDAWLLNTIAVLCGAKLDDTWKGGHHKKNGQAWDWAVKFIEAHDRRQLTAFAKECMPFGPAFSCVSVAEFAELKRSEQRDALQAAHERANLRMPKMLSSKGGKGK